MADLMIEPYDFLPEDLGTGDVTSEALLTDERAGAIIVAKEDCVIAGIEEAVKIFENEGLRVLPKYQDGQMVENGQEIMSITGDAKSLLKAERLALNFMCRMSGIATTTRMLVDACHEVNPNVKVSATRKTTPGFREWEKKAVILGGGVSHRVGLWDQILIKDNHLMMLGSITKAVKRGRVYSKENPMPNGQRVKVEVEVVDMGGAIEAAKAGPDIIMLDNMTPWEVEAVATEVRKIDPEIEIEISGGITPDNIMEYAEHADVISLGWLTHSTKAADLSLQIVEVHSV